MYTFSTVSYTHLLQGGIPGLKLYGNIRLCPGVDQHPLFEHADQPADKLHIQLSLVQQQGPGVLLNLVNAQGGRRIPDQGHVDQALEDVYKRQPPENVKNHRAVLTAPGGFLAFLIFLLNSVFRLIVFGGGYNVPIIPCKMCIRDSVHLAFLLSL